MEAFDDADSRVDSVALVRSGQRYRAENQFEDVGRLGRAGVERVVIHSPSRRHAPSGASAVA